MQQKFLVTDEKLRQSILIALADPEMVKIMNSAIIKPRSINDIIRETDIAHTTAYRKIKWMLNCSLLTVDKIVVADDGKKFSLIKGIFRSISVRYDYDVLSVEAERNVDVLQKTAQRILSLDS